MPPNERPAEPLSDVCPNSYVDSTCFLGFSGVCTVHALCFLRRNSTLEYFARLIVNILLVLIPMLVIPLCIFYDFIMLDGGFSCVPTTLCLDS